MYELESDSPVTPCHCTLARLSTPPHDRPAHSEGEAEGDSEDDSEDDRIHYFFPYARPVNVVNTSLCPLY
jgi:hypothetical protein